jgi:hypothetical protein
VSRAVVSALRGVASALVLTCALTGCGSDDGGNDKSAPKPDVLLTKADLAPLVPTAVSKLSDLPKGTQYYSCSEEGHTLTDKGWSFVGRDLRNTADNWAVDSAVLDNTDGDSALQLAQFRNQVDQCNAKDDAHLVEFSMGKDRYAYRSITPDNVVDTVRAYALVGEHRLVQVTVMGLDEHSAPDRIESLLDKAVQKAS